jgi:plastocyanin
MKSIFIIAIAVVAMIGMIIPSAFADDIAIVTVDESGFSQACVDTGCYVPLITTVRIGDTVTMTNSDPTGVHTFTSGFVDEFTPYPDGMFDTSVMLSGDSFEWVPTQSGEYLYYCMLHTWMVGLIEVQGNESPVENSIPISLTLILDPIPSSFTEGEDILFSGILMTSDGVNVITDAEIQIKDDRAGIADLLIGVITTDENGIFSGIWSAELRPTNGAYDFYAVFEDIDFGTQSERYSVNVTPQIVESAPTLIVQSTKTTMNLIQSPIKISKTITITGMLTTSDGIPISNKEIQLSNYPYDLDILSNPVITNSKGEFSINWIPEKLSPYYLRTDFNGDENYRASKSSFSGQEVYVERLNSSISLDSFQSNILPGSVIIFSGNLNLEGTNPSGQTVYIKDEDALDTDDVLATAVVDSNGFFSTNWVVEDVDSDDRKNAVEILELYDPISFGGVKKINQLFNTLQSQTVEIYASFEETATFKKSDTCITQYADDGTSTVCQNNVLTISGGELGGKELLDILTDDESKNNQSELFSILEGGEISDKDIESLEEMLLDSKYVQEQNLDQQEMSLENILTLLENPNSLTDNFEQTSLSDFGIESTLENSLEKIIPNVEQFENILDDSKITFADESENIIVSTISNEKLTCGTGTIEKDGTCIVDTTIQTEKVVTEDKSSEEGGGCLIATATYGSELSPQVQQLRELRDNQLLNTASGTQFMGAFNDIYYSFSPVIADYERENPMFREMVKIAITPMISSLSLMENAESESEVISLGLSVIMLNIGMYLGVPAVVVIGIRKIK